MRFKIALPAQAGDTSGYERQPPAARRAQPTRRPTPGIVGKTINWTVTSGV